MCRVHRPNNVSPEVPTTSDLTCYWASQVLMRNTDTINMALRKDTHKPKAIHCHVSEYFWVKVPQIRWSWIVRSKHWEVLTNWSEHYRLKFKIISLDHQSVIPVKLFLFRLSVSYSAQHVRRGAGAGCPLGPCGEATLGGLWVMWPAGSEQPTRKWASEGSELSVI